VSIFEPKLSTVLREGYGLDAFRHHTGQGSVNGNHCRASELFARIRPKDSALCLSLNIERPGNAEDLDPQTL
jgi:hypothetical protein